MTLKERIKINVIKALKESEKEKTLTLRMLQAAIKDREIDLHKRDEGLSDEEVIEVLLREIKNRRDSMEAYSKGGRQDLVDKEARELDILEDYLPPQMAEDELKKEIMLAIEEVKATSAADMGKVLKIVMPRVKGRASSAKVVEIVKQMLQR